MEEGQQGTEPEGEKDWSGVYRLGCTYSYCPVKECKQYQPGNGERCGPDRCQVCACGADKHKRVIVKKSIAGEKRLKRVKAEKSEKAATVRGKRNPRMPIDVDDILRQVHSSNCSEPHLSDRSVGVKDMALRDVIQTEDLTPLNPSVILVPVETEEDCMEDDYDDKIFHDLDTTGNGESQSVESFTFEETEHSRLSEISDDGEGNEENSPGPVPPIDVPILIDVESARLSSVGVKRLLHEKENEEAYKVLLKKARNGLVDTQRSLQPVIARKGQKPMVEVDTYSRPQFDAVIMSLLKSGDRKKVLDAFSRLVPVVARYCIEMNYGHSANYLGVVRKVWDDFPQLASIHSVPTELKALVPESVYNKYTARIAEQQSLSVQDGEKKQRKKNYQTSEFRTLLEAVTSDIATQRKTLLRKSMLSGVKKFVEDQHAGVLEPVWSKRFERRLQAVHPTFQELNDHAQLREMLTQNRGNDKALMNLWVRTVKSRTQKIFEGRKLKDIFTLYRPYSNANFFLFEARDLLGEENLKRMNANAAIFFESLANCYVKVSPDYGTPLMAFKVFQEAFQGAKGEKLLHVVKHDEEYDMMLKSEKGSFALALLKDGEIHDAVVNVSGNVIRNVGNWIEAIKILSLSRVVFGLPRQSPPGSLQIMETFFYGEKMDGLNRELKTDYLALLACSPKPHLESGGSAGIGASKATPQAAIPSVSANIMIKTVDKINAGLDKQDQLNWP